LNHPTVQIRTFTWEDLAALAGLLVRVNGDPSQGATVAQVSLRRRLTSPGSHPEEDLFLAWSGEHLIGHAEMVREQLISRAVMTGSILPERRNQGVGRLLVDTVAAHAGRLRLGVLHTDVPDAAKDIQTLMTEAGFTHVRTHRHLQRVSTEPTGATTPQGYTSRLMEPGDVKAVTELQNTAFTGSWGYSPNTPQEIRYRIYELYDKPDGIWVLTRGKALVAYCWTHEEGPGQPGIVGMVGVAPSDQGQGLGRSITGVAIDHLLASGTRQVDITVDDQNAPALRLYRRLGFQDAWFSYWYELRPN
jgi:mycothiol synthase